VIEVNVPSASVSSATNCLAFPSYRNRSVLRPSGDFSDDILRLVVGRSLYSIESDIEVAEQLDRSDPDKGWTMRTLHLDHETAIYHPRFFWRDDRARCPTEGSAMFSAKAPRFTGLKKVEGKPVAVLLAGRAWDEEPMFIIRYTQEGFDLQDVVNMLSTSELYRESELVQLITGKSIRTIRRLLKEPKSTRLGQQQSMVAFQYAHALEFASEVFHGQARAEEWLNKATKWLNGYRPVELIENPLGYQVVNTYLYRMKHGIYQ
jgi:putative toxin-antitoxin system antitoxin component (TIGR02293 family)